MDLPQELIDSIIDAIVDAVDLAQDLWLTDKAVDVLATLRSCSLAARTFVCPCQAHIFRRITLSEEGRISPELFSHVCATLPHLASYVRALCFEYTETEERLESFMHILESLKNLIRLELHPHSKYEWQSYPAPLRAVFLAAFALPSIRHITLRNLHFAHAPQLQTVLSESAGLKTLVLGSDTFGIVELVESPQVYPEVYPRVILDSLQIHFLDAAHVQAIMNSFTAVDITGLRSLYLHNTSAESLLKANAPSIQHLKLHAYYSDMFLAETVDALAGALQLQSLEFITPSLSSISRMVRIFGPLDHLASLRTLCITVSAKTHAVGWRDLDKLLGELPALAELHVYSRSPGEPHPEPILQRWMPLLAPRGVLRLHDSVPKG
ncbi:hypothetical protein DFH09DRAFT_1360314 [Mycena vulgaris]|nr:hypothetical protein DFH09DRAFT_1360314 [Mycena vulgaris]